MGIKTRGKIELDSTAYLEWNPVNSTLDLVVDGSTVAALGSTANVYAPTTAVNATGAEVNAAADISVAVVQMTDADQSFSALNSGKPHLVPNVSADRTFTLPTPQTGLEFRLYAQISAADGHDWIIDTGSDTNFFNGAVVHLDTDAVGAGTEIVDVAPNGSTDSIIQVNLPEGGTFLHFICDGTNWTIAGMVASVTAPVFSSQP